MGKQLIASFQGKAGHPSSTPNNALPQDCQDIIDLLAMRIASYQINLPINGSSASALIYWADGTASSIDYGLLDAFLSTDREDLVNRAVSRLYEREGYIDLTEEKLQELIRRKIGEFQEIANEVAQRSENVLAAQRGAARDQELETRQAAGATLRLES